jgi:hypothetical protein
VANTCTICRHAERDAINAALIAQEPYRRIAARTGTTPSALRRHKAAHLPVMLTKAVYEAEVVQLTSLLEQMQLFQAKTLSILAKAEAAGDFHIALLAIREGRANAELLEHFLEKQREDSSLSRRLERAVEDGHAHAQELEQYDMAHLLVADAEARAQALAATRKVIELLRGSEGARPGSELAHVNGHTTRAAILGPS